MLVTDRRSRIDEPKNERSIPLVQESLAYVLREVLTKGFSGFGEVRVEVRHGRVHRLKRRVHRRHDGEGSVRNLEVNREMGSDARNTLQWMLRSVLVDGYHGESVLTVEVEGGRITRVEVDLCEEVSVGT